MTKYTLSNTKQSYSAAWSHMEIHPHILPKANSVADKIISLKDKYLPLQDVTGVPWYFIGLLHMRESNFDFQTHLHNGDPLNKDGGFRRTVHVPANRPVAPPKNGKTYTFEESAIDALTHEFGKVKEWNIEQIAFLQEKYNGFGYRQKGKPSPYLWAGSNQYVSGKYIRDGVYDATVVDTQLGVMVVLKCIIDKINPIAVTVDDTMPEVKQEEVPLSPGADIAKPAAKELRKVSRKFRLVEWMRSFFGWTTGVTTAGATLSTANISATKNFIDTIKAFGSDYGIFIFIGALVVGFLATQCLIEWMKQDVAEGRAEPSGDVQ